MTDLTMPPVTEVIHFDEDEIDGVHSSLELVQLHIEYNLDNGASLALMAEYWNITDAEVRDLMVLCGYYLREHLH